MAREGWSIDSWQRKPMQQAIAYEEPQALADVVERLKALPPLVTAWEIDTLRKLIADAQQGKRFLLQGGDCAETLADCSNEKITNKLKILLQMSLVLIHGFRMPVIRVGRLAGQYAKPRSAPTEKGKDSEGKEVELPSYFGDLVNDYAFTSQSRHLEPERLIQGYFHAAMTLNHVRSLASGGFADLHHPEYWDLSGFRESHLPQALREEYEEAVRKVTESLNFMGALGEMSVAELSRVDFFTSHEGLNLHYEAAQTRNVPHHDGTYDLTTHFPWIGERTRQLDGAHVEFFRGIRNPVGVKVGSTATGDDILPLLERLNPDNEPGKIVLISRMGANTVKEALPPLVKAVTKAGLHVLWVSDPMHANTKKTQAGHKTRDFGDMLQELDAVFGVHESEGTHLGGIHFELTGEDVTECTGGAAGITEDDLSVNYETHCDPRLNYSQALEMAFRVARRAEKKRLG